MRLNISASAISRQMQILEQDLNTKLLERLVKGVELTADGRALLKKAEFWLSEERELRKAMESRHDSAAFELRIGVNENLGATLLPGLQRVLSEVFANVALHVTVGTSRLLSEELANGALDLVIAFSVVQSQKVRIVRKTDCRIGLVCAPELIGDVPPNPSLADCLSFPLYLPDESLSLQPRLDAEISRQRAHPEILARTNSIVLMRELIAEGRGVGFLTWYDVSREVETGRLCFLPLSDKRLAHQLVVAISGSATITDTMSQVLNITERVVSDLEGRSGTALAM